MYFPPKKHLPEDMQYSTSSLAMRHDVLHETLVGRVKNGSLHEIPYKDQKEIPLELWWTPNKEGVSPLLQAARSGQIYRVPLHVLRAVPVDGWCESPSPSHESPLDAALKCEDGIEVFQSTIWQGRGDALLALEQKYREKLVHNKIFKDCFLIVSQDEVVRLCLAIENCKQL